VLVLSMHATHAPHAVLVLSIHAIHASHAALAFKWTSKASTAWAA
jgi:hypothetical protein